MGEGRGGFLKKKISETGRLLGTRSRAVFVISEGKSSNTFFQNFSGNILWICWLWGGVIHLKEGSGQINPKDKATIFRQQCQVLSRYTRYFYKKIFFFFAWASIFLVWCYKLSWDFLNIFLNFYLFIFFNSLF